MYLRCLTVLGRDKEGIIKYKVGDREEKFYTQRLYGRIKANL